MSAAVLSVCVSSDDASKVKGLGTSGHLLTLKPFGLLALEAFRRDGGGKLEQLVLTASEQLVLALQPAEGLPGLAQEAHAGEGGAALLADPLLHGPDPPSTPPKLLGQRIDPLAD